MLINAILEIKDLFIFKKICSNDVGKKEVGNSIFMKSNTHWKGKRNSVTETYM